MIFMALIGGAVSFVLGLVLTRFAPGMANPGFFKALGISCGAVLAVAGVGLFVAWLRADFIPQIDGRRLELAIEVRCPAGFTIPKTLDEYGAYAPVRVPGTRKFDPQGKLDLAGAKEETGHSIVTAVVPPHTSSSHKVLDVHFSAGASSTFGLPLRSHPGRSDMEWSQWVDSAWETGKPEPPKEQKFNLRYKVQLAPPPPTEAEQEAATEKEAARLAAEDQADQARFDALGPKSPIQDWFPYTKDATPAERMNIAVGNITARPNYVAELAALMIDTDDDVATNALYLVAHLPQPQPALVASVAAAGRDVAARIRRGSDSKSEQDPYGEAVASAAARFKAWTDPAVALRKHSGGDFTAELRPILELSRVRTESRVMRLEVRRSASYQMLEWAKVEPLPGELDPR